MKFICLGYYDEKKWEAMPEDDMHAIIDKCFTYDDELRRNGHFAGGEALQSAQSAKTLHWKDGDAVVIDGPFTGAKEVLGGILILEARDMDEAVKLMAKHPGVKVGPFEIRPAGDMEKMIQESEQRRTMNQGNDGY